ncbi:MAG: carbon-nitrogen hydrolase family protein [Phycisphaerales bacterium]
MGAEVILHPTLTPSIDRDVELAIAKSTAAVNQCFVIDINGVGDGGNGRSILVAPDRHRFIQATSNEEMLPIEIDLERVQRTREVGLKGLGQPLKSFRDRKVNFSVYDRASGMDSYLRELSPLERCHAAPAPGINDNRNHDPAHPRLAPPAGLRPPPATPGTGAHG